MIPDLLKTYARDVAFVTFTMLEVLDSFDETTLPNGCSYHAFGGIMGFCDHAGDAGLALAEACDGLFTDSWDEIVGDFARAVIAHAIANGKPASEQVLRRLAADAQLALPTEGGAP